MDNIQELPAAQSRVIPPEQETDGLRIPRGIWILPVALLAMYSTSFLLPAAKAEQTVFGWEVFGACVRSGVLLGLLPNVLFLGGVCCLLMARKRWFLQMNVAAGVAGGLASVCGLTWLSAANFSPGYLLWEGSMVLLAVVSFFITLARKLAETDLV